MKKFAKILLTAVVFVGVTGCSSQKQVVIQSKTSSDLPAEVTNKGKVDENAIVRVGVVSNTNFTGLLDPMFYTDNLDQQFAEPVHEPLFGSDESGKITENGLVMVKKDTDKNMVTLHLREGVKWSDGTSVTVKDIVYPYLVMGSPKYTGVRYNQDMQAIEGMAEYHAGEAKDISGLTVKDDQTLEIQYSEIPSAIDFVSGALFPYAEPAHILSGTPIEKLPESDQVQKPAVTLAPYVVDQVVPGESIRYVPNEEYYGGTQKTKALEMAIVPSESALESVKAEKYDLYYNMPIDLYPDLQKEKQYTILGKEAQQLMFLGFKVGYFDQEKGENVPNGNKKVEDKALRQAMGYALDNDVLADKLYNGLRQRATSPILPMFEEHDNAIKGYPYEPKRAEKILDDAGYEDRDKDGFRETPDGEKLTINFAMPAIEKVSQTVADDYVQKWKEVGLNVELKGGRVAEPQAFVQEIMSNTKDIDIFTFAYDLAKNPYPNEAFGKRSILNVSGFTSDENNKLLAEVLENDKRSFTSWQKYMQEEAFVIPSFYKTNILPVGKYIKHVSFSDDYIWKNISKTK